MSILAKLTPEQIVAFDDCTTKEELAAKAKELGLEPTEAELDEAMALISAESGELSDDALDAVAGGGSCPGGDDEEDEGSSSSGTYKFHCPYCQGLVSRAFTKCPWCGKTYIV